MWSVRKIIFWYNALLYILQWSYGVLCWEVFSTGKTPYPGLDPVGVVELLDTGGRLQCPHNEACSQEMYELPYSRFCLCGFNFCTTE